jgi:DnaJ-domain-containing protein 1
VVKAAFMIAAVDGEYQEAEEELIYTIAGALGMSESHLKGTLTDLTQQWRDSEAAHGNTVS